MTTEPKATSTQPAVSTARQPAEGRDELGIPGADRGGLPDSPPGGGPVDEEERRDRLADRTELGRPSPVGEQEADVLPDVEVPEHQM